jgi:hypothetical protein
VRYVFLDDRSRRFFDDWEAVAHDTARILRIEAGRDPSAARPHELIDELLTVSEDFRRTFWARHAVRLPASGRHHFRHPRADPDLTLLLATAEPDSPTSAALAQLAMSA